MTDEPAPTDETPTPSPETTAPEEETFREWLLDPKMLVAFSAIVLSICGLFISIYETSLIRHEQRAAVWPHLEVGPSISSEHIGINVRNAGIGPARVQAAAVTYDGQVQAGWDDLLTSIDEEAGNRDYSLDLLNNRVLAPDGIATTFAIQATDESDLLSKLANEILAGTVDMSVCYCSVYDQCWTTSLQDQLSALDRLQPEREGADAPEAIEGPRPVDSCEGLEKSAI